jgi:hypothetical protein
VWGVPALMFWGLVMGNSARHNASALLPMVLLVASLVMHVSGTAPRAAILSACMGFINYFSDTVGHSSGLGTMMPKSNVIQLSADIAKTATELETWARGFARLNVPKKAIFARSSLPFAVFEELVEADRLGRFTYDGTDITINLRGGGVQTVKTSYVLYPSQTNAVVRKFREDGYTVWRRDW